MLWVSMNQWLRQKENLTSKVFATCFIFNVLSESKQRKRYEKCREMIVVENYRSSGVSGKNKIQNTFKVRAGILLIVGSETLCGPCLEF